MTAELPVPWLKLRVITVPGAGGVQTGWPFTESFGSWSLSPTAAGKKSQKPERPMEIPATASLDCVLVVPSACTANNTVMETGRVVTFTYLIFAATAFAAVAFTAGSLLSYA